MDGSKRLGYLQPLFPFAGVLYSFSRIRVIFIRAQTVYSLPRTPEILYIKALFIALPDFFKFLYLTLFARLAEVGRHGLLGHCVDWTIAPPLLSPGLGVPPSSDQSYAFKYGTVASTV
jgi:hypothetical protein